MAGWCSAVGWNWTNSTSAVGTPARSAMATPSPVDSGGLVVTEKSWPAPPVASTTWSARTATGGGPRRLGGRQRGHPDAAPAFDDQVEGEPALEHRAGGAVGGVDQGPLDLGAGGGAAGVDDPRPRVAALAGQRQRARWPRGRTPRRARSARAPGPGPRRPGCAPPPRRTGRRRRPACRPGAGRSSPRRRPSTAATPPWAQRVADWDSAPLVSTPSDSGDPPRRRPAGRRPTARPRRCPGPGRRTVPARPRRLTPVRSGRARRRGGPTPRRSPGCARRRARPGARRSSSSSRSYSA